MSIGHRQGREGIMMFVNDSDNIFSFNSITQGHNCSSRSHFDLLLYSQDFMHINLKLHANMINGILFLLS